jgi:hypothetical protein
MATACATSRELEFSASRSPEALATAMPKLAGDVIEAYREPDRRKYLDNLFRLQLAAGRYADAGQTLRALRSLPRHDASPQAAANDVQYEIYASAKARQAALGTPFAESFAQSFREAFGRLDDRTSALVIRALDIPPSAMQETLSQALSRQQGKRTISLADALALVRAYQFGETYRGFAPSLAALIAEDDRRRYVIEKDIPIRTPDGATVCAMVVRPRATAGRLPALLNFTIYADPVTTLSEARRTASNGYIGVEGFTRGKGCSPDQPVPYEHDGADAAAVIDWISGQAWSDGRVGMYGGSYEGFTQWAAAKHMPTALKALMPSVTAAPGIDVPMEGNLFYSFVYYWPFYIATGKGLDEAVYNDHARWRRMQRTWYASGKAYRALDEIDGTPNPIFERWLDHPSYDAYWQDMIPYGQEFARIHIPVLTTTGYYDDAQIGALYYFNQHHQHDPSAEHYLVIGPYDHIRGQRGTINRLGEAQTILRGYETDPVAQLDLGELRYQWFDHVFKGSPRPALLKDKVNYEVMGGNEWRHAPTLAAMGERTLRFHLRAERAGDAYRLGEERPLDDAFVTQTVDLADRTDVDRVSPSSGIVDRNLDTWNSVAFVSDPLPGPLVVSGLFAGRLDFIPSKKDLDFSVTLYELTPGGDYVELSHYLARASYVRDRSHRELLSPGQRQQLDFQAGRLTSRRFQPGSRLVAVLGIVKQPELQINYGTGKDVSDETIADAQEPLQVKWFGGSFIDVPTAR